MKYGKYYSCQLAGTSVRNGYSHGFSDYSPYNTELYVVNTVIVKKCMLIHKYGQKRLTTLLTVAGLIEGKTSYRDDGQLVHFLARHSE